MSQANMFDEDEMEIKHGKETHEFLTNIAGMGSVNPRGATIEMLVMDEAVAFDDPDAIPVATKRIPDSTVAAVIDAVQGVEAATILVDAINAPVYGADWNTALGEARQKAETTGYVLGGEVVDRAQFLARRRTGLGGSDAGTIAGLNPFKTPYELWLEKTGLLADADLSDNEAVEWGTIMEPVVAWKFAKATGKTVIEPPQMYRHPEHEWMIANVDRLIEGEDALLEIKTTSAYAPADDWGAAGTDKIPDHYMFQVQHYMAVTGLSKAYLAVLIGGNKFRIYNINRHDDLIDTLIALEEEFWRHVVERDPPSMDFTHKHAMDAVKRIYPGTNGEVVQFGPELYAAHLELEKVKAEAKVLDDQIEGLKAKLRFNMGECAVGLFPDGSGYRRKLIEKGEYVVKPSSYIDFRYSKTASKKA